MQTKQTPTEPPSPFRDRGNGIVEDIRTNIYWEKCSMGQIENSGCEGKPTPTNWLSAMQYCAQLKLANKHWDLPTSQELTSLIPSGYQKKVNANLFPNKGGDRYWSATSHDSVNLFGIVVNLEDSKSEYKIKYDTNLVRCLSRHKHKKTGIHNHHENWSDDD